MRRSLAGLVATALSISPAVGQEGFPAFTTDFTAAEFAARRLAVAKSIGPDAIAVLQGAASPPGYVRFRQSNEVYYLTGLEVPHIYVVIEGGTGATTIFASHRNPSRERSEGRMPSAEDGDSIVAWTGAQAVVGSELLTEHLGRLVNRGGLALYTPHAPAEGAVMSRDMALRVNADIASDPWDGNPSREGRFIELIRRRLPRFEVRDLSPTLDSLRLVKSPAEVALIRRSSLLAGLALMEAMRSTEPGVIETELDGLARFIYFRNGAREDSYYSLVPSGRNGWYPHYHANKRTMEPGEFVLMDYAPNVGYYNSDVTRVWPVSGKFGPEQRMLYSFYLACYNAIIAEIKPGVPLRTIKLRAADRMDRALAGHQFSKPEYARAAKTFVEDYRRGAESGSMLGHWVGMATHDVGGRVEQLQPGMVFSIEPALRVPEERIYIRLEDMFVVTETGAENLSGFVPTEIDAIERLMAEQGILQRYPRAALPRALSP